MKSISEPFIRRPVVTVLLALAVAVVGVFCYRQLPVSDLPTVAYPVISVQTAFPGMDPETMAANVATPLEKEFLKIQGLDMVTSTNLLGMSSITLQFSMSRDIDSAAGDVQRAIQRAMGSLPPDLPAQPTFAKADPNSHPIFFIALGSGTLPMGQLYDYATNNIAQRFNTVSGVSQTDVYGARRAVRIAVDPAKLYARGLTMTDVAQKIQQATATVSAGSIRGDGRDWVIRPDGQLDEANDYGAIVLAIREGLPIHLRDVADCFEGLESSTINASFWMRERGSCEAVMLAVTRAASANTVAVSRDLRALLPEIQKELPDSVFLRTIYDSSERIIQSIDDVQETLLIAFALVALVIFLFLGRLRDTLIPIVALPLSFLILFIAMWMLGFSLDTLSMMAMTLSVGFLVDDAIVFLENMVRRMQKRKEFPAEAASNGAGEIAATIVSMTLSLLCIFLPLLFLGGQVGRVFHEFAVVIVVATLASGVVSLTVTPLMCARMISFRSGSVEEMAPVEAFAHRLEEALLHVYGRALDFFLDRRWIALSIWAFCLAGTFLSFRHLPKTFLPDGDSGMLQGVFIAQEGVSQRRMSAYQAQVDGTIRANPAVDAAFSITGFPGLPANQGIAMTFLRPAKERAEIHLVTQQLWDGLASIPGAMAFVQPVPSLRIQTGTVGGSQGKYAYTITGIEREKVCEAAQRLMGALRAYGGIASISSDMFLSTPQVNVRMNRDQLSGYGGTVLDLEQQLKAAYSDNYVYLIKTPMQQYRVVLSVADGQRAAIGDMDLVYPHGQNGLIDPSTASSRDVSMGPLTVNHTNNFPSATIFFNLAPDVAIGDAMDHINRVVAQVVPAGLSGEFRGEAQAFAETFAGLKLLIFAAIFLTYIILGILYESYAYPITVLSALPVAAFGGCLTLLLFRQSLSLYSFIGLFMLLGLVEKNGIMIVDFAVLRQREGMSPREAIHAASLQRLRPILMTTLAMVMGVIPICLGWGADGSCRRSLGLVVAGGMIFAQMITLFVTPVIHLYLEAFQSKVLDKIPLFHRGDADHANSKKSKGIAGES
ncbi:MAG: efflux RND transporter permease subunit [Puniceicoccales bacterium]|jgi:HAE1 family hydrophobic/amphiphilic exporter-1|nr:efflux RND transporter permease subunit [Puniceicoccales bacterium]